MKTYIIVVGYPRNSLANEYLQGPRSPKLVRKSGYGFTRNIAEAWPFTSKRAAEYKARIVDRHMGWGEGVMIVEEKGAPESEGKQ